MESQLAVQYCITTLLCLVMLFYIYIYGCREFKTLKGILYLRLAIAFSMVFAIADISYAVREFHVVNMSLWVCYLWEIIYSLASLLSAYFWYVFSETTQESETSKSKKNINAFSVVTLIMIIVTVTTPLHHLFFYFDEEQHYIRGKLNILFTVVSSMFIAETGLTGYIRSLKKENYTNRYQLKSLSLYAVILFIAQMLQIAAGSIVPFRTIGAAVLFFTIREINIKQNITQDSLTKINNRFTLEQYLENNLANADSSFFFMMLDLDDFKKINDKFGHLEGDRALQIFAEALELSSKPSMIIARYGGDEFSVGGYIISEKLIDNFINSLTRNVEIVRNDRECEIPIEFSYGYVMKTPEMKTVPDIIKAADEELYKMKNYKKCQD